MPKPRVILGPIKGRNANANARHNEVSEDHVRDGFRMEGDSLPAEAVAPDDESVSHSPMTIALLVVIMLVFFALLAFNFVSVSNSDSGPLSQQVETQKALEEFKDDGKKVESIRRQLERVDRAETLGDKKTIISELERLMFMTSEKTGGKLYQICLERLKVYRAL